MPSVGRAHEGYPGTSNGGRRQGVNACRAQPQVLIAAPWCRASSPGRRAIDLGPDLRRRNAPRVGFTTGPGAGVPMRGRTPVAPWLLSRCPCSSGGIAIGSRPALQPPAGDGEDLIAPGASRPDARAPSHTWRCRSFGARQWDGALEAHVTARAEADCTSEALTGLFSAACRRRSRALAKASPSDRVFAVAHGTTGQRTPGAGAKGASSRVATLLLLWRGRRP